MSLVVAYKKNGIVYMGADTQLSSGTAISRVLNESGFKIARFDNGILLGMCGSFKGCRKVVAQKQWFDVPDGETISKRYIVKNIIPQLSIIMKDVKDNRRHPQNSSMCVELIIAHKDKMFLISDSYDVYECSHYVAIGAGCRYSKYMLSQINENDVNEGLLKALREGAYFDSSVSAPYVLIDTLNTEYKIVES